ncbi:hypothetical protein AVEN_169518-1 [Araneus ventricosus]|uniref:Uncharacterized protein n=1 Tax=Araneus ventricosus TaxID=182803 RepID=A0A4Y2PS61_ARAVE|nr:hypothetical protein AVEN_169518-1 [Araneus ventricosus]
MKIPKDKGIEKRPNFHNLALEMPTWQPCFKVRHIKVHSLSDEKWKKKSLPLLADTNYTRSSSFQMIILTETRLLIGSSEKPCFISGNSTPFGPRIGDG